MARTPPRTKAGKQAKVGKVMGEFKSGDLKSSSGARVTNPKQAVAIALSESGQARPQRRQNTTQRLAGEISRRIDERQKR